MLGRDELITGRTLLQALQHIKDATSPIIQQQDAEVTAKVLVPQGILVIEEAQVADNAEDEVVSDTGEASCRRERAVDAIHTAVAPDLMAGIDIGQTDG